MSMERTPGTGPSLCTSRKPEKMQMGEENYKEFGIAAAEGVRVGETRQRDTRPHTTKAGQAAPQRACPAGQMCP